MAVAAKAFGWVVGPILVLALLTAGSVVLTYLLGISLGLSGPWALTAAALVGLNPIVVLYSLVPMTDIASMFWCVTAITAAAWSRKRAWLMLVSGVGLGIAVLVRPSNAVLLPSVLLFSPLRLKHLVWLVAGGLPVGIARLTSNVVVFGNPFGNDLERTSNTFGWQYVNEGLAFYGHWFSWLFGPLLLTIGVAGSCWLAVRGKRSDSALWLWITSYLFLYAATRFAREGWWLLRYLMPAFPAFFIAAARATDEARVELLRAGSHRILRRAAALSLLGVWLWAFVAAINAWREWDIPANVSSQVPLAETVAWIESKTPDHAVFAATQQMASALYFNTDAPCIHLDFEHNDPDQVRRLRDTLRRNRTPLYAIVWYREAPDLLALEPRRWVYLGEYQQWFLFRDS
jgi:4-amino-4-deoxy-L-arabinose transferase-like glycosyltransferase